MSGWRDEEGFEDASPVPRDSGGPIVQEGKKGHALFNLGNDVYLEVSEFRGKVYAGVRKWFRADDGMWYRTKNGLNMKAEEWLAIIDKLEAAKAFIESEKRSPWSDE